MYAAAHVCQRSMFERACFLGTLCQRCYPWQWRRNGSKVGLKLFIHKWVWLFISGVGVLCSCHHAGADTGFSKRGRGVETRDTRSGGGGGGGGGGAVRFRPDTKSMGVSASGPIRNGGVCNPQTSTPLPPVSAPADLNIIFSLIWAQNVRGLSPPPSKDPLPTPMPGCVAISCIYI